MALSPLSMTTMTQPVGPVMFNALPTSGPADAPAGLPTHRPSSTVPKKVPLDKIDCFVVALEEQEFIKMAPKDLNDLKRLRAILPFNPLRLVYFNLQDRVETEIVGRKPRALIIGANNGVIADALMPIIMAHEWPVTLVEGIPKLFEDLKRNYGKKYGGRTWEGVEFVNKAVTEKKGTAYMKVPRTACNNNSAWKKGQGKLTLLAS